MNIPVLDGTAFSEDISNALFANLVAEIPEDAVSTDASPPVADDDTVSETSTAVTCSVPVSSSFHLLDC